MVLLSQKGLFGEGLSVIGNVLLEVIDPGLNLVPPGDEQAVDEVLCSGDVGFGVLDALLKLDHEGVMLVGSLLEVEFQLLKGLVKVIYQFLDGVNQLLDRACNCSVKCDHVQESSS